MTDQTPTPEAEKPADNQPQFRVLTQYIKDVSFENPGAPASLQGGDAPAIDLQIGVGVTQIQDGIWEVALPINISAKRGDQTLFLLELVYCGLFALENIPEDSMEPALHIECPRLLFPYARRIVSDLTQDGGFPALPIEPIDFAVVYRARLEQMAAKQAGQAKTNGNGNSNGSTEA